MNKEFKMSMMGELTSFFRLQIKQLEDGIFINQIKYVGQMLKEYNMEDFLMMQIL